eukprot:4992461-Alexandrium_andersonii.AAC.1
MAACSGDDKSKTSPGSADRALEGPALRPVMVLSARIMARAPPAELPRNWFPTTVRAERGSGHSGIGEDRTNNRKLAVPGVGNVACYNQCASCAAPGLG